MLAMLPKLSGAVLQAPIPSSQREIAAVSNQRSGERWYVIHTKPRGEVQAVFHLERQGYSVFCPRCRKTARHARKTKSVMAPLFPNYLFLQLDLSRDRWLSINGTRGVVRMIMHADGTPQPIPIGIVEALRARMNVDGAMDWLPSFKVGQTVRIADGPFVDLIGTLEHLDGAGRVRVLLDLLGRSVCVALQREVLMPAV
jgi:transcription elongation factor/antiterminator RfaH